MTTPNTTPWASRSPEEIADAIKTAEFFDVRDASGALVCRLRCQRGRIVTDCRTGEKQYIVFATGSPQEQPDLHAALTISYKPTSPDYED